jgi:ectoine hydroxylase-related dioxygenase (phytanoyl-CoA dioxygenase family)
VSVSAETHVNQDPTAFFEEGYVVLADVIPRDDVVELQRSVGVLRTNSIGGTRLLVNERELLKDKRFFDVVTQPRLLELLRVILGDDLQILDIGVMKDPPATGRVRSWHSDFHHSFPIVERPPLMVTMLVYLDDMSDERGPLFVKPGTHKLLHHPTAEERSEPLAGEVKIAVPAGTAVVFHSNLWHSGSRNNTREPRRLLFSLWGHYWIKRLDEFYSSPLPDYVLHADDPWVRQLFGAGTAAPSVHGDDYNPVAYGG